MERKNDTMSDFLDRIRIDNRDNHIERQAMENYNAHKGQNQSQSKDDGGRELDDDRRGVREPGNKPNGDDKNNGGNTGNTGGKGGNAGGPGSENGGSGSSGGGKTDDNNDHDNNNDDGENDSVGFTAGDGDFGSQPDGGEGDGEDAGDDGEDGEGGDSDADADGDGMSM